MLAGVSLFIYYHRPMADERIRDWSSFIKECIRLVRPGGLLVFVDMDDCFKLAEDMSREERDRIAPAYARWCELVERYVLDSRFNCCADDLGRWKFEAWMFDLLPRLSLVSSRPMVLSER
jgi:SAM-dependent methyltransferase